MLQQQVPAHTAPTAGCHHRSSTEASQPRCAMAHWEDGLRGPVLEFSGCHGVFLPSAHVSQGTHLLPDPQAWRQSIYRGHVALGPGG